MKYMVSPRARWPVVGDPGFATVRVPAFMICVLTRLSLPPDLPSIAAPFKHDSISHSPMVPAPEPHVLLFRRPKEPEQKSNGRSK